MKLAIFLALWSAPALASPRWISTSPELTELIFQIGKGEALVGSVQPSSFPAQAATLASIGFLYQPSIEATLRLRPSLVVVDESLNQLSYQASLSALNIPALAIKISNLRSLETALEKLLALAALKKFRACMKSLGLQKKNQESFEFLALTWTDPPIAYGHTSFISDLLTLLGGTNILPKRIQHPYPLLSTEWLIQHQPEKIFFMTQMEQDGQRSLSLIKSWWPRFNGPMIPLAANHFGRATLTPFRHLEDLKLLEKVPEDCLGL